MITLERSLCKQGHPSRCVRVAHTLNHCLRQPCLHLLQASKQEALCYKKRAEDMEKDQWCKFTLYLSTHHSA